MGRGRKPLSLEVKIARAKEVLAKLEAERDATVQVEPKTETPKVE